MTNVMKLLLAMACVALCCIQEGQAWWSWSRGRRTVTVRPDVRLRDRYWGVRVRWTFSSRSPKQVDCRSVEAGIISRAEWDAEEPAASLTDFPDTPKEVFVYHTGPGTCDSLKLSGKGCAKCMLSSDCLKDVVADQQELDHDSGLDDIKYNFLIGEDGLVYEGRGWDKIGEHTVGKDQTSIGIAMIGDFREDMPNQAAQDALNNLLSCGKSSGKLLEKAPLNTNFDRVYRKK